MPYTSSPCFTMCGILFEYVHANGNSNTSRRFCENNPDPNFASCCQPQELSDDEIDKQLAGSEVRKDFRRCRLGAALTLSQSAQMSSCGAAAALQHRCSWLVIQRAAGLFMLTSDLVCPVSRSRDLCRMRIHRSFSRGSEGRKCGSSSGRTSTYTESRRCSMRTRSWCATASCRPMAGPPAALTASTGCSTWSVCR